MGRWKEERGKIWIVPPSKVLGRQEECNASDELENMRKKKVKESLGAFGVLHNLAKD